MSIPQTDAFHSDLAGARRAIYRAAERARAQRFGIKVAIWENGQVQYVSPETCQNKISTKKASD